MQTQEPCIVVYVTEDQELANGYKSHLGGYCDSSFLDRLKAEGIANNQIIHIEYVDVRDGGVFAEHT